MTGDAHEPLEHAPGCPEKQTDGINRTPYSDYIKHRSATFDYAAAMRSKSQLVAPPEDKPAQPEVVKAYELALSGVDDTAGPLWLLISKAKDLLGLFNNLTAFTKWYNATPGTEQQLEVNHPRLQ